MSSTQHAAGVNARTVTRLVATILRAHQAPIDVRLCGKAL